jgi:hypothetical protein
MRDSFVHTIRELQGNDSISQTLIELTDHFIQIGQVYQN